MIKLLPHEKIDILSKYLDIIKDIDTLHFTGKVEKITGLTIESIGPSVKIGEICKLRLKKGKYLHAEVVGFNKNRVILMPIGEMQGVVPGTEVIGMGSALMVSVGPELLGRVISGIGTPLDNKGDIYTSYRYPVQGAALMPLERKLIDEPLSVGVRAIDGLNTVGKGQRIGIFSGTGVGKSTLLGMIARNTNADINVIALIGERGREVRDFIDRELGSDALKKTVVVAATSDQPPMMRIRGAFLAHSIAEFFRDQGKDVNLLMDSVTRFAFAQREVGLARGEPTAMRGYPPSVFSLLPQLLERSGAKEGAGSVTGFYSVLVEADDMNEPISDAVRGVLDGHIALNRNLAQKGHYPAIDVLGSISRLMKDVTTTDHLDAAFKFRELLAAYTEAEDLINLGAYAKGSNPVIDHAIEMKDKMDTFLKQGIYEQESYGNTIKRLIGLFEKKEAKL